MDIVRDEWIDRMFSCQLRTDRKKATKYINWLYKLCNLGKPNIIFLSSPLGAQYGANILKSVRWAQVGVQVRDQVGDQVSAQVRDQVRAQVWVQVRAQVGAQVRDQVGDQVGAQVSAQVRAQVRDQVLDQVRDQKMEVFNFSFHGSISDYGWVSFYEYFKRVGKVKLDNFNNFVFLLKSGVYDMIQFKKVCIVSDMPIRISRNSQNRLHNENTYAIEWGDGFGLYFFNGVAVHEKIILHPEKLTKKDWMNESNQEVRRVIQEQMGERFVKAIGSKEIHKSSRGRLVEVDISPDPERVARYVEVKDSSTSRKYYLRVPPTTQTTDEAVAWTFGLDVGSYKPEQET